MNRAWRFSQIPIDGVRAVAFIDERSLALSSHDETCAYDVPAGRVVMEFDHCLDDVFDDPNMTLPDGRSIRFFGGCRYGQFPNTYPETTSDGFRLKSGLDGVVMWSSNGEEELRIDNYIYGAAFSPKGSLVAVVLGTPFMSIMVGWRVADHGEGLLLRGFSSNDD